MNVLFAVVLLAQTSLAPLLHASPWIGREPNARTFAGKVVVVDIFTYSCINCKHVVPELRRLRGRYGTGDLIIVGVHTPELPYERVKANVVQNLALQGITWPVVIDNDSALWDAYGIEYWPTQLIFDRKGTLRKTVIGDGQDDAAVDEVQALVAER